MKRLLRSEVLSFEKEDGAESVSESSSEEEEEVLDEVEVAEVVVDEVDERERARWAGSESESELWRALVGLARNEGLCQVSMRCWFVALANIESSVKNHEKFGKIFLLQVVTSLSFLKLFYKIFGSSDIDSLGTCLEVLSEFFFF